jgi:hypothetical protein
MEVHGDKVVFESDEDQERLESLYGASFDGLSASEVLAIMDAKVAQLKASDDPLDHILARVYEPIEFRGSSQTLH